MMDPEAVVEDTEADMAVAAVEVADSEDAAVDRCEVVAAIGEEEIAGKIFRIWG